MKAKPSVIKKAKLLYETTNLPATRIGLEVALSADTVRRYARTKGWSRGTEPVRVARTSRGRTAGRPRPEDEALAAPQIESVTPPPALPALAVAAIPTLSTAERCRELLLRVLAAAERHIGVVEQRIAAPRIDVAAREKEVRVIAVLTRLVNDINHVLGPTAQEASRGARAEKDGEDGVAQSADRRRQDFSDRLDALLGGDPAGGVPDPVAGDA